MTILYVLGFLAAILTCVGQMYVIHLLVGHMLLLLLLLKCSSARMFLLISSAKVMLHCIKNKKSVIAPLQSLVPFFVMAGCFGYWGLNSKVFVQHPAWSTLLVTAVFVEVVVHMMLMHLCHSPLNIYRWVRFLLQL